MMKTRILLNGLVAFTVCLLLSACNQKVEWISTTESKPWVVKEGLSMKKSSALADVKIDVTNTAQIIKGFGACFNELGWNSISRLKNEDKQAIFTELFKPGVGANFTICRMPVGANDFSLDWYSYNESEGDFEMKDFSIKNDLKSLVPFIHEALKYNPGLEIWASPWSPPKWMKWNKNEFNSCQIFPSCTWTAGGLAKFIGQYLGPEMENQGVELFNNDNV